MINLIRNEFTKVFKKKGIYITLLITLVFIILINILYTLDFGDVYNNADIQIEYYEKELQVYNPQNQDEAGIYASIKSELDILKLIKQYGGEDSWQAYIINNLLSTNIYDINYYKYVEKDEQAYEKAKKDYDNIISKINNDDWKSFVQETLNEINSDIEYQKERLRNTTDKSIIKEIEKNIEVKELEKQLYTWRIEKDIPFGNDYKNLCLLDYEYAVTEIANYEESSEKENYEAKTMYYSNKELAAISKYDIENKTEYGNEVGTSGVLKRVFNEFELFIIIITVMISGSIISEEFSKGTIKLLLIKPYKRTTILAAKFITCVLLLIFVIILIVLMQIIVGGIVGGFEIYNDPVLVYNHNINQLEEVNIFKYVSFEALGKLPMYLSLLTLAFSLSTIFSSSGLSITIGLLGYMGGTVINELTLAFKLNWIKFFVTPNWDLTQYFYGNIPIIEGLTLGFSLVIITIYLLIMLVPTFITFKRKNIKNV